MEGEGEGREGEGGEGEGGEGGENRPPKTSSFSKVRTHFGVGFFFPIVAGSNGGKPEQAIARNIAFWKFLLELLCNSVQDRVVAQIDPNHEYGAETASREAGNREGNTRNRWSMVISWVSDVGHFFVKDPLQLAVLWGRRKDNPNMSYASIRQTMR